GVRGGVHGWVWVGARGASPTGGQSRAAWRRPQPGEGQGVSSRLTVPLSSSEVERFAEQGFLVVDRLLPDADLEPLIELLDGEVARRAEQLVAAGELSRTYRELRFERQLAAISRENESILLTLWSEQLIAGPIFRHITHPTLLDVAAQMCGSDEIIASSGHWFRPKVPGHEAFQIPWHQDGGYMHPACDRTLILTIWMPLVDSTDERGCLWVRPMPHATGRVFRHRQTPYNPTIYIDDEDFEQPRAIPMPVRRGGAVLFHNLPPHGSFANTSDSVRWTCDVRYANAATRTNAAITRLPGEARLGPDMPAGGCLPPMADFLARSRLRPTEVVADESSYVELRRRFTPGVIELR